MKKKSLEENEDESILSRKYGKKMVGTKREFVM